MTTLALVQSRVWRGYGIAARNIGMACSWYRPSGPTAAIASGNLLGTLTATFDTKPSYAFAAPSDFGKPNWFGLFDPTNVLVGDYLLTPAPLGQTFFVASIESLHPPLCVLCNGNYTVTRPGLTATGANYYGGLVTAGMQTLATLWPMAIAFGERGLEGNTRLPGDQKQGVGKVLAPPSFPVEILPGDVLTDNETTPVRYVVETVEKSALGWRLIVRAAGT